jgi:hypothetical protein
VAAAPLNMPSATVALPPTRAPRTRPAPGGPGRAVARTEKADPPPAPPKPPRLSTAGPEPDPTTVLAPDNVPTDGPSPGLPDPAATPRPTTDDEPQESVIEGEPCDPEGAPGLTDEDVALICVRDDDGRLVWQIN